MNRALLSLALIPALLPACGGSEAPAVRVLLSEIPPDARTLEARFTVAGRTAEAPQVWSSGGGFHSSESFVVVLPAGGARDLAVTITAVDENRCVAAAGDGSLRVEDVAADLSIALRTDERAGCALTITTAGAGAGVVRSDPAALQCPPACQVLRPRGSPLSLTAEPDGSSAFIAWSGDCAGNAECQPVMDRPRSVGARFSRRGVAWVRSFGGSGHDLIHDVAIDPHGNVLVTGASESPTWTVGDYRLATAGLANAFVVKLDPAGEVLWARDVGGPGNEVCRAVATRGDHVLFSGDTDGQLALDGVPLSRQAAAASSASSPRRGSSRGAFRFRDGRRRRASRSTRRGASRWQARSRREPGSATAPWR